MRITLNGQKKEFTSAGNLSGLINQFSKNTQFIIAEVNGEIVKSPQWEETLLNEGDTVELVSFMGGG